MDQKVKFLCKTHTKTNVSHLVHINLVLQIYKRFMVLLVFLWFFSHKSLMSITCRDVICINSMFTDCVGSWIDVESASMCSECYPNLSGTDGKWLPTQTKKSKAHWSIGCTPIDYWADFHTHIYLDALHIYFISPCDKKELNFNQFSRCPI